MSTTLIIPEESSPGVPLISVSRDQIDSLLSDQGLDRATCTELSIPSSLETIEGGAFSACTALTTITFRDGGVCGVTSLAGGVFNYCPSLTEIGNILSNVTIIQAGSFNGCGLTSINIPSQVTSIEDSAFFACALSTLTFSSGGVDDLTIGNNVFKFCRLTNLNLPNRLISIGDSAFENNFTLADVYFYNLSATPSLGVNAFTPMADPSTAHVYVSANTSTITGVFDSIVIMLPPPNVYVVPDETIIITAADVTAAGSDTITEVSIPSSVTTIEANAFKDCIFLSSIIFRDGGVSGVTTIGANAFENSGVTNINTLLTNISTFGNASFQNCIGLASVTIPSGVTTIGDFAFDGCTSLTNVYFLNALETPAVGSDTFLNIGTPSNAHVVSLTTTDYTSILGQFTNYLDPTICFKEGSLILTDKGYVAIQFLRKGDLVKTSKDGFKSIDMIGFKEINHVAVEDRINDQLYVCSTSKYPEVFEDLVLTGSHSILVDNFISEKQKQTTAEVLGQIYVTDNKYRLPACVDDRASVYKEKGIHTIYHLALENDNYYMNYGIYANGLLVETCSKRYLKELSNITLIE